jgi:uncharacterized paraquat-inducible protein A
VTWEEIKMVIATTTGLERDALHIYAALLIQVAAAALSRRTLRSPLPWLAVLVFALGNEYLDITADGVAEDWEWWTSLHDLWNTMLVPTLLLILVRFAPSVFLRRQPQVSADEAASPDS